MGSIFHITKKENRIINEKVKLQDLYKDCIHELDKQQSKRDQLIVFFISIAGLLTTIIAPNSNISNTLRGITILFIALIGILLVCTVIRYRKYKEVYWVTARTLSTLFSEPNFDAIDEFILKNTLYSCLTKLHDSKCRRGDAEKKLSLRYAMKREFFSAETLLFFTIKVLVAALLFLGIVFIFSDHPVLAYILGGIVAISSILAFYIWYCRIVINIYKVVEEEDEIKKMKMFKSFFESAWFLHMF